MGMLKDFAARQKKLHEEYREKGKEAVEEALKDLFDKHPNIKQVEWTQYAPHFNDGEPCVFSVHEVWAYGSEGSYPDYPEDEDIEELLSWSEYNYVPTGKKSKYGWDETGRVKNPEPEPQWHKDLSEFESAIHSCEELMEHVFGDAKVVATRDGITYDYTEHD